MADRSSLLASIQAGKSLKKVATVDKSAVKAAGGVVGQPGEKPVPEKADESEPDLKSLKAQLSSMFDGGPPMPSPKRATSSVGADSTATATAMPPLAPPPLAPPSLAPPALTPPPLAPPHQHSPHGHRWLPHPPLALPPLAPPPIGGSSAKRLEKILDDKKASAAGGAPEAAEHRVDGLGDI